MSSTHVNHNDHRNHVHSGHAPARHHFRGMVGGAVIAAGIGMLASVTLHALHGARRPGDSHEHRGDGHEAARHNAHHADAHHADGHHVNGHHADGHHDGHHADGHHADGQHADGHHGIHHEVARH